MAKHRLDEMDEHAQQRTRALLDSVAQDASDATRGPSHAAAPLGSTADRPESR